MIPEETEKPADRRIKKSIFETAAEDITQTENLRMPMPLLNTPYELGKITDSINKIQDDDTRNIALGEYYYFSGHSAKASEITKAYLTHNDLAIRLSACWIYAYANLSLGSVENTRKAMAVVKNAELSINETTPELYKALIVSISTGASVLLHLPLPKILSPLKKYIHIMPAGLRLFILYVEAHHCYLNKQYGACIGIAETALALESELYPIPSIYLHLVATMGYVNLRHLEPAKEHLLEAWKIAQPDDMIEAFAEHHGLLGGMLEAVIKKEYPEDFQRIFAITYSFSAGWRRIHNPDTGHNVAYDLTTTEFAVAMLASKDWSNKEIGAHLGISTNTVKLHVSSALQKLGISQRKELIQFMLK
jgi:DNA-binding CsgD family transcriptional regulator